MSSIDFEALALPGVRGLRAYDPGHDLCALRRRFGADRLVELGSNENVFGPSPLAKAAMMAALESAHIYPDPLGGELKQALAAHHGIARESILLGNGSHELLMQLAQVFAGPGREVVASQYGFAVYALAAQASGATLVSIPALPVEAAQSRGHDLAAMAAAVGPATALVYLANPNNPTGTWVDTAALRRFLAAIPRRVLVVVDEAYIEYVTDPALVSARPLLGEFPNLIVTRTFSKAHGLASLRVGYLLAQPGLVAVVERVRESFNVNAVALAAATAALADADRLAAIRAQIAALRDDLRLALIRQGWQVPDSQTNFLLCDFGRPAAPIEAGLLERGVVVRPMAGYGLPNCLRITVGTADQNLRLLQALAVSS